MAQGERDPERRLTHRNGYRERRWDTRVGTIELAIPRVRDGSYFPTLLEPRRRAERALLAVVQEAYVRGVSTRRVDDLVRALGIEGISKSEVSRICAALDAEVEAFRTPAARGRGRYPYLWLDATYLKVREGGRVVSMAALVATGVATTGERRVLGLELAAGQRRGLAPGRRSSARSSSAACHGVRLVISDDHAGLVKAVREQLLGSGWQRCRVHFTRNAQDLVPALAAEHGRVGHPLGLRAARRGLGPRPARAGSSTASRRASRRSPTLLAEAEPDLLAHFTFPETHRRQIRSTNPQERLNKEIKRRTAVVGHLPQPRLRSSASSGMILAEQDDEWQDGRRYFRPETMAAIDAVADEEVGHRPCSWRADRSGREDDALLHHVLGLDRTSPSIHRRRSSSQVGPRAQRFHHAPARSPPDRRDAGADRRLTRRPS